MNPHSCAQKHAPKALFNDNHTTLLRKRRKKGTFSITSLETANCPICGEKLKVKDRRKRQVLTEYGKKKVHLLRRLYCQKCKKLHLEIPDFIIPHKWYEVAAIEAVLTGKDEACPICTRTKKRWKKWYGCVKEKIDALCQSLLLQNGIRLQDVSRVAETTKVHVRLKTAAMLIINSGEKIPT